jgi:hypothetical protein
MHAVVPKIVRNEVEDPAHDSDSEFADPTVLPGKFFWQKGLQF